MGSWLDCAKVRQEFMTTPLKQSDAVNNNLNVVNFDLVEKGFLLTVCLSVSGKLPPMDLICSRNVGLVYIHVVI